MSDNNPISRVEVSFYKRGRDKFGVILVSRKPGYSNTYYANLGIKTPGFVARRIRRGANLVEAMVRKSA